MKTQSTVIQTVNLTKDYDVGSFSKRKLRALDHLDLEVEEGETFGLIGPNGAGKTTTLKLLMGLVFPTEGEAKILGKPIGDRDAKSEIGYLPEQPYFYDYLTGRELLNYFGQLFGLSPAERGARVDELLDKVKMTEAADLALRKYSKGMTQRIGIAQALINRPKVVFFDEPMSGLDPLGRREMTLLIRELCDSGVTVFFCSHILPDVEQICDRVAILNEGKLVEIGRLNEILNVLIQAIEVEVENLSDALEAALRGKAKEIEKSGTRARIVFERREDFDAAVGPLTAGGARLLSVTPVKQTLEEYFVAEIFREKSEMNRIGYIALNTFRETVRDKVLYNLVLFALLMIASSYILGTISVYQEVKIINDLGLASISVFGMVIAIFIGISLVSKEIEKRTLYSLLPKPISREQFILGKYLGLCLTLLVNVAIMSAGFYLLLFVMGEPFESGLLKAIVLIYVKLMVLVGVAILFSTFTSPTLAGLFTGFTYVAGYYSSDLKNFDSIVDSTFVPQLTTALYYALPNFKNFDIKAQAVAGAPVPLSQIGWAMAYALVYIALLLMVSSWIFKQRNLK